MVLLGLFPQVREESVRCCALEEHAEERFVTQGTVLVRQHVEAVRNGDLVAERKREESDREPALVVRGKHGIAILRRCLRGDGGRDRAIGGYHLGSLDGVLLLIGGEVDEGGRAQVDATTASR